MTPTTHQKTQKLLIVLHCSYDNNYQQIYEPVYDQNIVFYNEEEFEFDEYIKNNSSEYFEA